MANVKVQKFRPKKQTFYTGQQTSIVSQLDTVPLAPSDRLIDSGAEATDWRDITTDDIVIRDSE